MRRNLVPSLFGLALGLGCLGLSAQKITIVKPGQVIDAKDGIMAVMVDKDTKVIEEKTLIFDGYVRVPGETCPTSKGVGSISPVYGHGYEAEVPDENRPIGDHPNGYRLYSFTLSPKEIIHFTLKVESPLHVGMQIIKPTKQDPMAGEFARIKRIATSLRCSNFHVRNITDAPYTIILQVYGSVNYPYKLLIERS
jgi:hypothetical protein